MSGFFVDEQTDPEQSGNMLAVTWLVGGGLPGIQDFHIPLGVFSTPTQAC